MLQDEQLKAHESAWDEWMDRLEDDGRVDRWSADEKRDRYDHKRRCQRSWNG